MTLTLLDKRRAHECIYKRKHNWFLFSLPSLLFHENETKVPLLYKGNKNKIKQENTN